MNPQPRKHSLPVCSYFGVPSNTEGEVGLELEVIGKQIPMSGFHKTKLWKIHPDGSIKPRVGENAIEYVLAAPLARDRVPGALNELHAEFEVFRSQIAEDRISNSVHVHINAQTLTIQQVYTWLALYFIFEDLLVRWAGPDRVGNLFCLRARDAEGLIRMLKASAETDDFGIFNQTAYRYAAANVVSLTKFGSLEFRALRGTVDRPTIQLWVDTLLAIKDKSLEYKNPTEVLADFSMRSTIGMANHVLPPQMRNYMLMQSDFPDAMYNGARLAQDFAFATLWEDKPVPLEVTAPPKKKRGSGPFMTVDEMPAWVPAGGTNANFASLMQQAMAASVPPQPQAPTPALIQEYWFGIRASTASGGMIKKVVGFGIPGGYVRIRLKPETIALLSSANRTVKWVLDGPSYYLAIVDSSGNNRRWITSPDYTFEVVTPENIHEF